MSEHSHQAAYDAALAVQRRHEHDLLALVGVSGVGTALVGDSVAIVVSVDPDVPLPPELIGRDDLDGVRLVVRRERWRAQGRDDS